MSRCTFQIPMGRTARTCINPAIETEDAPPRCHLHAAVERRRQQWWAEERERAAIRAERDDEFIF